MKNTDHLQDWALQVSERLSVLQEPVDFFLREQFDAQCHTRLQKATFRQSEDGHVRNTEFLGSFTHCEGVSLQRLGSCILVIHAGKNGKRRQVLMKWEIGDGSRRVMASNEKL